MPKLLVIDDDRTVHKLVEHAFDGSGIEVFSAGDAREGEKQLHEHKPDVLLMDIMLPEMGGLEVFHQFRDFDPKLPIIFVTALNDSDTAIQAMQLGAYDYLLKPLDIQQIQDLVERALETRRLMLSPVFVNEAEPPAEGDLLVGRSSKMLEVYKQIGRVAAQDVTVLIRGESGTGKELIARAIYHHSHRKGRSFLAVNCAALSDTLLESELFGHEKGAFTGADRRHIGKFEQCNGGTIFLDEIGDMSPLTQSKVLRLLQEQKFERVGGTTTIETDVRIISATNRNLEQMIEEGVFRLDLFHRLNAFEIDVPPLRKRGEDLELLIDYFLARASKQLGKEVTGVAPETMQLLKEYPWPGNVRELASVIGKALLMASGPVIVPDFLPKVIVERPPEPPAVLVAGHAANGEEGAEASDLRAFIDHREAHGSTDLYAETLAMMERYLLTRILRDAGGNQSKAAERLGITRGSLRNKIRALGITIGQVVDARADAEDDAEPARA